MKLMAMLTIVFTVQAHASVYSQNTMLDLELSNKPIREALRILESNSKFKFFFNEDFINVDIPVTVQVSDAKIDEILDRIFEKTGIYYRVLENNMIVLTDRQSVQQLKITGTVTDATTGEPLPGVNILVEGTLQGVITDASGKYSLNIENQNAILFFSYIGYVAEKIQVSGQSVIDVKLIADITKLEEVVVIGYGTQKKKDLSGSVVSVKADDIKSIPVATMEQALIGRASGVQVIQNANPGSVGTIRIRGVSTTGNNDPLWIIDGIPSGPGDLNPGDIESMDVLKDASAAAIYGSRSANGVIIVTTKRGKEGKPKVEFDSYFGFQSFWKKLDVLNSQEFATLANQASINSGWTPNPDWASPSSLSNTDWQDAVSRKGIIQNYNLSVSGGNEKLRASLSMSYNKTEGPIILSDYDRYTIRLNADYTVNKRLKFGSSLNFSRNSSKGVPTNDGTSGILNQAVQMWPDQPVYNPDGSFNILLVSADPKYYSRISVNPVAQAHLTDRNYFGQRFTGSLFGELEIVNGLKFKSTIGIDAGNGGQRIWAPKYITDPQNTLNRTQSYINWTMSDGQGYTSINTLTYTNTFSKHNITVLGGMEAGKGSGYNLNAIASNTPSNALTIPSAALTRDGVGSGSTGSSLSYFGRINYIYNDKYILQFNVRADASNKFAPENRWGYFPSGSAAWRISKENFMQPLQFINDLKVRGSYGITGNANSISGFPYLSLYGLPAFGYALGTGEQLIVPTYQVQNLGNPDLKWETQKMTDFGLDAMLFNNVLSVTIDYYDKVTDGLLVQIPVPATIGAPSNVITKNAGEVKNSGFELAVNYNGKAGDFEYNIGANITTVKNEVLSLGGGDIISSVFLANGIYMDSRTVVGRSIGEFYGYVTDGIYQNVGEIPAGEISKGLLPGDRRYKDVSGPEGKPDGTIDDRDRTYLGSPIPKFFYGFNLSGSYKGFDFSIVLQGQKGNKILNEMKAQTYNIHCWHGDGLGNVVREVKDSWHGEGTSNTLPRLTADFIGNNWLGSDFYVEDGSFLRCRTMQVGYTLPASIVNRVKLGSVRVYVNAQNLFTLTNYTGYDPEILNFNPLSSGVDWGQYPVSRAYTMGINVQF